MSFFQKYELYGVKYVHCGDDFWRLIGTDGYVINQKPWFTTQESVEQYISSITCAPEENK